MSGPPALKKNSAQHYAWCPCHRHSFFYIKPTTTTTTALMGSLIIMPGYRKRYPKCAYLGAALVVASSVDTTDGAGLAGLFIGTMTSIMEI